jgi:hypothetical protein
VTGDLLRDEGIEATVNGVGIIVHCAGSNKGDDEATRNLVRAASRAGAWNWRSAPQPGWCPTLPGRGCTGWPICSAGTCGLAASIG